LFEVGLKFPLKNIEVSDDEKDLRNTTLYLGIEKISRDDT
jgi:hypothetical protein